MSNKSFGRRVARKLSTSQKKVLSSHLTQFSINHNIEKIDNRYKEIYLEIGSGMGENIAQQARKNPNNLYIAVEVYKNGVANLLKLILQLGLTNIKIWPDDINIILNTIPDYYVDVIYLLFPDPWLKKRHNKRRIINDKNISTLYKILSKKGKIIFSSDIKEYVLNSEKIFNRQNFEIIKKDENSPYENYIPTKYHIKAKSEKRSCYFLECNKISNIS